MYKIKRSLKPIPRNSEVVAIDQYPAQEFNIGFNGMPANDLTLLERAQTLAEAQLIASRLTELRDSTTMEGLTDREIVKRIKPNWVQTPAEIDRFMDYYYNNVLEPQLGKEVDADDKTVAAAAAAAAVKSEGSSEQSASE